ncbi:DUF4136 domain-containing protein [Niastella populi]|uniref:DUF4136 domain-containing protein n=1 Tax=Niastella populi TaxID=550983 RepID=A0A1V9F5N1_9BACT|nr:DUF4136 domain-containing protein [Niastella populi]OQP53688.1 hypothetical protein A4R26_06895 [Niastella populi]
MKRIVIAALVTTGVLAMTSCRKDPVKNLEGDEGLIYITKHSDSANFGTFRTFSIADSVAVISNNQLEGKVRTDVDAAYINAVKDQLVQRGYTQVGRDQDPDLGVNISRIYNTSTGLFDYGAYWDPYYGSYWDPYYWGYGGYGYYFPSYFVGTYSITEGAMSIDIFNLRDAKQTNRISSVWNGLIRGSSVFNVQTAGNGVKALFDQSTYFSTSN